MPPSIPKDSVPSGLPDFDFSYLRKTGEIFRAKAASDRCGRQFQCNDL